MTADIATRRAAIISRLPVKARWTVKGTSLDWDFSAAGEGLHPLSRAALNCEPEPGWLELLIFGEYDYADGGGARPFLGVRQSDAVVCGLDVEREGDKLFVLNSSIEQFIETFRFFNEYLGSGKPLPLGAEDRVRAIDPQTFPASDWKLLLETVS
jgi:hypothetical protein